jgi:hypothetical protein
MQCVLVSARRFVAAFSLLLSEGLARKGDRAVGLIDRKWRRRWWCRRCGARSGRRGARRPSAGAGGNRVWASRRAGRGTSGFKVMAVVSTASTGVVPRLEQLLNMDAKPYTDKVVAEYIWYVNPRPRMNTVAWEQSKATLSGGL